MFTLGTIVEFLFQLVVIAYLKNPALKARHWMQIESILNTRFTIDTVMTLEMLEELGVFDHVEEITEISGLASSEESLEALLQKVSLHRDLTLCHSMSYIVVLMKVTTTTECQNV